MLPVIGSKELIASLPLHLGIGPDDLVVFPELAYPTYEVGAALVGARTLATDSLTALGPETPRLLWINSPSNPTGRVLPKEHLRKVVDWCRERGVLLVSDECYIECSWEALPTRCCTLTSAAAATTASSRCTRCRSGRTWRATGVRSSPATGRSSPSCSRCARTWGSRCPARNSGCSPPYSLTTGTAAEQHERYAARRAALRTALESAGFTIDHSEASLYLWATRGADGPDCWETVAELADLGILVAPGAFYGAAGSHHVRVAFTATDERVAAAAARLATLA